MKNVYLIPLLLALGGCATGNSDYGCLGMPEGVMCASAHDVYELTGRGENAARENGKKSKSDSATRDARAAYLPEQNSGVIPLRTPAKVMRIWINAWEGKNSDLQVPGLLYTEIEPRRWQIGLPAMKEPSELILLEPRPNVPATPSKSTSSTPPAPTKKPASLPSSKPLTGDQ